MEEVVRGVETFGQLRMAAGYLSVLLLPALLALGVGLDQPYLAFGTVMLVFPLARGVFGTYRRQTPIVWHEAIATFLDRLPVVYGIILLTSVSIVLGLIHRGAAASPVKALGIGLSLWMTMFFATCVAHDLIHRRSAGDARIGRIIAGLAGYPFLSYEHLLHHARMGDKARVECPRLDESVWRFAGRRIRQIARDTLSSGGALWHSSGVDPGPRHLRGAAAISLATWAGFSWAGGWPGFLVYLGVIVGVTFGTQLITYLQHWGLGDDGLVDAPVEQLAWEDDCQFQAWVTLHISFHESHHRSPRLPYYRVAIVPDSPRQPAGYLLLMLLCLFPGLWRKMMLPVLEYWKRWPQQPQSSGRRLTCFALYSGKATGTVN